MNLKEFLWGATGTFTCGAFEFLGLFVTIVVVCYVIYLVVKYIYDNICRLYKYTAKCSCKDCKYRNRDDFCLKFKCVMHDDSYCCLAEKKDLGDSLIDYAEVATEFERLIKEK